LLKRPAPAPPPQSGANAFVCSLEVESFDATATTIQRLGGIVALPKFAVPKTCWQGYFVDPEGNTFGIFEVDANAGA
jgi:predicted enzyme related to lactoylglutathione lyase